MPKRTFHGSLPLGSYRRAGSPDSCDHSILEAHVSYDMESSGYRAQIRCRCTHVKINGKKIRDKYAQAEEDGRVMLRVAGAHIAKSKTDASAST